MNAVEWTSLRARLNHDVLRNQVLTEIAAIRSAPEEVEPYRLTNWLSQTDSYLRLLQEAPRALNPGILVESYFFAHWPEAWKRDAAVIFRDLFWHAYSIEKRLHDLNTQLDLCHITVDKFLRSDRSRRTKECVLAVEAHLSAFSKCLSELPRPTWAFLPTSRLEEKT